VAIMLRVYLMQQWFNLSDPGVEEALYESAVLRRFVGVDLGVWCRISKATETSRCIPSRTINQITLTKRRL
jgi:IS5 family transposase